MADIHVLLIDDDVAARKGLAKYLSTVAEFEVKEYTDGAKALKHLETTWQCYAAVLLDFVLAAPVSGEQVLDEIRNRYPRLPVIVFTGRDPKGGVQALAKGAYRYMRRPINQVEMANIVRSLAEQDMIFYEMARNVRRILGSDMCLAWRLDRLERGFRVAAWDGDKELDEEYRRTVSLSLDDPATREFFINGWPIYLRDVTDPGSAPKYRHPEEAQKRGWTSLISIPLIRQQRVIGLIDSYTYERCRLTDGERAHLLKIILPALANQASEAVRNAELSDQLQALHGINEVLASIFEEKTVIRQILFKGLELVGTDIGWLCLVDMNTGELVVKDGLGVPEELIGHRRKRGEGITGWVAQEGQAWNVPDVSKEPRYKPMPGVEGKSEVAVPLRREEQTIGVLTAKSRFLNAFTDDDVNLLTSLAAQATIAIERAKLTKHVQEVSRLAPIGDFDKLAYYVVEAVRDLTGADVILWMMSEKEGERRRVLRIAASRGNFDRDYIHNATSLLDESGNCITRLKDEAKRQGWRSSEHIPLFGQSGEHLGSLSLYSKETAGFSEPEIEFMRTFANHAAIALQTVSRIKELEVLNEIGQAVSAEEEYQNLLELVLKRAKELVPFEFGSVTLIDEYSRELVLVSSIGLPKGLKPPRTRIGEGITGWVAKYGRPLRVDDVWNIPRIPNVPKQPRYIELDKNTRSELCVPLRVKGQVIGVLNLESYQVKAFDEKDQEQLVTLASQSAIAIENVRTHEHSRQQSDALRKIVGAIGAETDPLPVILKEAVGLFGAEYGSFSIVDPDAGRVNYCAIWERGETLAGKQIPRNKREQDWQKGIVGYVARMGQAYRTGNVTKVPPHISYIKWYKSTISELAVPLKGTDERVLGVLNLESPMRDAFSQAEEELCQDLANVAATALEKARLFEAMQQVNAQMESLHQAVQEQSLEEVLDRILEGIDAIVGGGVSSNINLYEEETNSFYQYRAGGPLKKHLEAPPRPDGTGRYVVGTGKPLYLNDVHSPPPDCPTIRNETIAKGVKSSASLPLRWKGQIVGVLFVHLQRSFSFSEGIRKVLELFASQAAVAIENARLHAQRRKDIAALQEVNEAIATEEWTDIVALIAQKAQELTQANYGALWLINEERTLLSMQVVHGREAKFSQSPIDGHSINGWVAMTGEPYVCPDIRKDPHCTEWYRDVKSTMTVPLRFRGRVIGTLNVESTRLDVFSDYQLGLLQSLADQAAVAIENARLFRDTQRRIRDMEIVNEVVQIIGTKLDTQGLLTTIASQVTDKLNCTHCTLFFAQEEDGQRLLVPQVTHGQLSEQIMRRRFKPGEGIAGWVFQHGESVVLDDVRRDPRFSPATVKLEQPRSMLVAPVKVGDQTVGVISADQDEYGWFSESDRCLADALARHVGIAIERASGLQLLQDIGNQIIGAQEVDKILQQIVTGAIKLTNTNTGVIYLISADGQSVVKSFHPPGYRHPPPRLERKEGLTRHVIETGRVLSIPDIHQDPRVNPVLLDRFQSMIAVPLKIEEKVIGVLYLNDEDQHEFTETEVSLLLTLTGQAAIVIENARQRRKDIAALQEVNEAITTKQWTQIAALVAQKAQELTQADYATLWLANEKRTHLFMEAIYGREARIEQLPIDEHSINGRVASTGEPFYCPDVGGDPHYMEWYGGVKSSITVPLKFGDRVIGTLNTESGKSGAFSNYQIGLLQSLADQAAIAIENAHLFRDTQRRIRDMEIVNEVVQIIGTKLDTRDLLATIVSQVADKLKCIHCTLFFAQEEDGQRLLVPQVTHGQLSEQIMRRRFKLGEGIAGWVFQHGESVVLDDARKDPRFSPATVKLEQPRSMLVAPVKVGDQTVGVISADQDEYGWFSGSDRRLVDALARHVGIAIERARGLQLLQDIGNQIVSLQDVDDILQQIVSGAIKLTNTTSGVIWLISEDGRAVARSFHPLDFCPPEPRLDRKEGITRHVIATGEVVRITDIHQDPRVNPVLLDRFQSMIAVPVKIEQKVIGVLYLNDEVLHDFTETEISLLLTLASQAAVAIENARLYQKLQEQVIQLERAQERIAETEAVVTRTSIAADFVHRLNNLAGTIPIWVDQIREYISAEVLSDETLTDYLDRIESDTNQLLRAAEKLKSPPDEQDVDMESMLGSLVRQALVQTPANIEVRLECKEGLPSVRAVATDLATALWNIMENGIDTMPDGGVLRIEAEHTADDGRKWVEIRISDQGKGIAEGDVDRVFSPFYSTKTGHMGYGLWRAKNIVERTGGDINFESYEGLGTTFIVRLPGLKEATEDA